MKSSVNISGEDIDVIKKQIGSDHVVSGEVAGRCIHGFPRIIKMKTDNPVSSASGSMYTAVSNLVWLTCPFLNGRIHRFENMGYIKKIESLLSSHRGFCDAAAYSHINFFYLRKKNYSSFLSENFDNQTLLRIFHSGVGGIRNENGLKCLHVHFSHYLFNKQNIAGYITARLLGGLFDCESADCGSF